MDVPSSAREVLQTYWGYENFRKGQEEIVASVVSGKDTIALLPTGGGKSICFQVPALCREGICLVVSPLIALMNDQVNALQKRGIGATSINSNTSLEELDSVWNKCARGYLKFVYVSPERLKNKVFLEQITTFHVGLLAIDEAHCISQWGFDFRPSYLDIHLLRTLLPPCPTVALTATATEEVLGDIATYLGLKDPVIFRGSVLRKNLSFSVVEANEMLEDLCMQLAPYVEQKQSVVVYVQSRLRTETVCQFLRQKNIPSSFYHAGMSSQERTQIERLFLSDQLKIIVATSAFGMGIDKPNIRAVFHLGLCDSIESYYQQAGRAGRDGELAQCVLFYHPSPLERLWQEIEKKYPPLSLIERIYTLLHSYAEGHWLDLEEREFSIDLETFSATYALDPLKMFYALQYLKHQRLLEINEQRTRKPQLEFLVDKPLLNEHILFYPAHGKIIEQLLRTYPEILSHKVTIDTNILAEKIQCPPQHICQQLHALHKHRIASYCPAFEGMSLRWLSEKKEMLDPKKYQLLISREKKRREHMWQYANEAYEKSCRQVFFSMYFSGIACEPCDTCDLCRRVHQDISPQRIVAHIQQYLCLHEGVPLQQLRYVLASHYPKKAYTAVLSEMVDDELLFIHPETMCVSLR